MTLPTLAESVHAMSGVVLALSLCACGSKEWDQAVLLCQTHGGVEWMQVSPVYAVRCKDGERVE